MLYDMYMSQLIIHCVVCQFLLLIHLFLKGTQYFLTLVICIGILVLLHHCDGNCYVQVFVKSIHLRVPSRHLYFSLPLRPEASWIKNGVLIERFLNHLF